MNESDPIWRFFVIAFCLFVFSVACALVPIAPAFPPPKPTPPPPDTTSMFDEIRKGYEAFKGHLKSANLLKAFVIGQYVLARGMYPFLLSEDEFQSAIAAADRS